MRRVLCILPLGFSSGSIRGDAVGYGLRFGLIIPKLCHQCRVQVDLALWFYLAQHGLELGLIVVIQLV